ncbi:hypothetical protein [Stygiolobus caldivivus]|uniref:Uncharacterized protein n=1 Tax=Stygiolobus caldivivus TaxID=2824673 RepID=A0A8D5U8K8_9CREN|nr:hypothetical protein [Stygiolobus caldivivus]BCU70898.1 hypothetical protein KN1_21950 [Stygiolobus caldivivus]
MLSLSQLRNRLIFIVLEVVGFLLIYVGFRTSGVVSVVTGVSGLLVVVIAAGYFTRCKPERVDETTDQTNEKHFSQST